MDQSCFSFGVFTVLGPDVFFCYEVRVGPRHRSKIFKSIFKAEAKNTKGVVTAKKSHSAISTSVIGNNDAESFVGHQPSSNAPVVRTQEKKNEIYQRKNN
jgi:hypothetical protein